MQTEKVDFVVTWLDSTDPVWQKEFRKYKNAGLKVDETKSRYRDWDLFRYWFRAVEQYAPWVNKVFLVTNGTFPKWINSSNPHLVLVKHDDYISKEYLPTFNSHTIELNMHKIPGLSEHFVYFNDDCYLNAPVTPKYYFMKGLPCDSNEELFSNEPIYNPKNRFNVRIIEFCDIAVLNYHFNRKNFVKQAPQKWFGKHLGVKGLIKGTFLYLRGHFEYFVRRHNEQPFLKSVFEEAWEKEETMLKQSCTRFREDVSLNPYFFRHWQFATNKFYPVRLNGAKFYIMKKDDLKYIKRTLNNPEVKSLCLNDSMLMPEKEYDEVFSFIDNEFKKKFPEKSSFEL